MLVKSFKLPPSLKLRRDGKAKADKHSIRSKPLKKTTVARPATRGYIAIKYKPSPSKYKMKGNINRSNRGATLISAVLLFWVNIFSSTGDASAQEERDYPLPPTGWLSRFALGELRNLSGKIIFSAKVGSLNRIAELDLDGRRVWMLVEGPGNNINPSWAPDGEHFAFVSDRSGSPSIFIADWDGAGQREIKTDLTGLGAPTWSSDGRKLFVAADGKKGSDSAVSIYAVNVENGSVSTIMSAPGKSTTPSSSVMGKYLAFSTNRYWPGWDICSVSSPNGKESCYLSGNSNFYLPRWAPNSELFAYAVKDGDRSAVGIYNLATKTREYETDMNGDELEATWSKNEAALAFTANNGVPDSFNLYYVDRPTQKIYPLLSSPYSIKGISWSHHRTRELETKRIKSMSATSGALQ